MGPWAKDPNYKGLGMLNLIQTLDSLETFAMRPFCGVLGWTTEEAQVLLDKVRQEIKYGDFHVHLNY
ncbi:hypothetical protein Ct61P_05662 [Colletotrichum tofieldiae]|nr:hypothetical protein Ct61P_05662 [Colletotrichum tofieldiae]